MNKAMEREIKFRGKGVDNGEWVYGYYYYNWRTKQHIIHCSKSEGVLVDKTFEVIPESVGQFTGLLDKNEKEIYDGDIVHYTQHEGYLLESFVGEIIWSIEDACWCYEYGGYYYHFCDSDEVQQDLLNHMEIIGSIHDNPELLK